MSNDTPMCCLAGDAGSDGGGSEERPPSALEAALALVSASPGLKSRNVQVAGRRTSIRLVPSMWTALQEIAATEGMGLNALVTAIDAQRDPKATLANSVRTFVQEYYRRQWQGTLSGGSAVLAEQQTAGEGECIVDTAPESE